MSYVRADEILPRELLEAIQQYTDGQIIYVPRKEKKRWGSGTSAREFFRERNEEIYKAFLENDHETAMAYGRDIDFLKRNNAELYKK